MGSVLGKEDDDEETKCSREIFKKCTPELWPYVWAINEPECLDWKKGKTETFSKGNPLSQEDLLAINTEQGKPLNQVSKYVFISDYKNAQDISLLKEYNITYVLNVAGRATQSDQQAYKDNGIEYLELEARDEEDFPLLDRYWTRCKQFLVRAQTREKRCLVHCIQGINRSGVVVAAHHLLLAEHGPPPKPRYLPPVKLNVLEVVAHCRRIRGNQFLWNRAFVVELVHLASIYDLLGPKPGEPGCIVDTKAPPYKVFKELEKRRLDEERQRKRKQKLIKIEELKAQRATAMNGVDNNSLAK